MAARAETRGEPITFTITGEDGGVWEFSTPFVPAGPLLDVSAAMLEGGLAIVVAFGKFLYDILPDEQHDQLKDALAHVDIGVATEVASWIIEQAVARPLGSPSESSAGESRNGDKSSLAAVGWTPSG